MIPNHWYAILESSRLKKKPLAIKRFNPLIWFYGGDKINKLS